MENNKLIAEFMGLEIRESKHKYITTYYVVIDDMPNDLQDLKYQESWDWLMPVIDKCYQEHMSKHIAEAVMTCNIDEAYKAVIEFIKWHNESKLKKDGQ